METKASLKYIAELLGTMTLVLIGCGSAVLTEGIGVVGIALAFGFTITAMVYTFGHISGAHFNPAVTIGMISIKRISAKEGMMYILFQCIGAIIGAGILYLIANGKPGEHGIGQTGYSTYSTLAAFAAEAIMTMFLLLTIFAATSHAEISGFVGIIVGLLITALVLMGFSVSGTGINPARSLGPALIAGGTALEQLWLYIVAPIVGALIASGIWRGVFGRR
jgi:aquaporin Z